MRHKVLVIEHESGASNVSPASLLADRSAFACQRTNWAALNPEYLLDAQFHLIIVVVFPGSERVTGFFQWLARNPIATPIMAVLSDDADTEASRALSRVADDFAFWPVRKPELEWRLTRLLNTRPEVESCRRTLREEAAFARLIGNSPAFVDALNMVRLIASSEAPVVLFGESGTGKELFAQAVHHLSDRNTAPFIPVECGAVPENLLENELFGHARGAFTDAHTDHSGLARMAEGGTLFLDEIDALSLGAQAKLLRFIQEGTYRALGSEKLVHSNVRIVAATNRDLEQEVHDRHFRLDLYFRLNVLNLNLPPLRERKGDIDLLSRHFVELLSDSKASVRKTFSPAALRMLEHYQWPGNVRELFNIVQRSLVFCDGPQILPLHIRFNGQRPPDRHCAENFRTALEHFEREYAQKLLAKHQGNVTHAAKEAGKDRRAFGRLVKKYSIDCKAVGS